LNRGVMALLWHSNYAAFTFATDYHLDYYLHH